MPQWIPLYLSDLIIDSTEANIVNSCTGKKFKVGDIATILIIDIEEYFPYAHITESQWCLWNAETILPVGFYDYLEDNREDFQRLYREYLHSHERTEMRTDWRKQAR